MKKAKSVTAWALWVPMYRTYVPVTKSPWTPPVVLYPSRAAARKAGIKRHSIPVRVKVIVDQ